MAGALTINIDGKDLQPLKKILTGDKLLELAGLDPLQNEIFLVDGKGRDHRIDNDEGLELQDGMEFKTRMLEQKRDAQTS